MLYQIYRKGLIFEVTKRSLEAAEGYIENEVLAFDHMDSRDDFVILPVSSEEYWTENQAALNEQLHKLRNDVAKLQEICDNLALGKS